MIQLELHYNFQISPAVQNQLGKLLGECFPGTFEGRNYFKQEPHFRVLASEGGVLVGQIGIDARIINVGGAVLTIFGVIDLCVSSDHRSRGIASALLRKVEDLSEGRDFIVLMADNDSLYRKNGFHRVTPAPTRWLAIEDRKSYGLIERDMSDCFMVKPLSNRHWPSGQIDMLGYLF